MGNQGTLTGADGWDLKEKAADLKAQSVTAGRAASIADGIGIAGKTITNSIQLHGNASLSKINAAVAETNAALMVFGAEMAWRQRDKQIADLTYRAGQIKAAQRVSFAHRGIAIGKGSAAEVIVSTEIQKEVDMLTAQMNGIMNAWGYRRQEAAYRAQAAGQRYMANTYRGMVPVMNTLGGIATAAKLYSGWASGGAA